MTTRPSPPDSERNNLHDSDSWVGDRVPDRSLFFPSAAHDRLLELVRHLTENTEDVALLIGPHGAGKTTLIYRIQGEAPDHWLLCRVDANPMLHPDQLLYGLARRITAPFDESGLTDDLHTSFGALRLQGRLPVVVVDDADQLPASSLMALLHLHERSVEGLPPFALILLAESAIDTTLASQQLHAMGTARFQRLEIPPLAPEQMDDYIRHFLRVEGVSGAPRLAPERLQAIHQEAGGWPGKVNEQAIRTLRAGAGRHHGQSPTRRLRRLWRMPPRAIAITAACVVLLVLGLLMFQAPTDRHGQGHSVRAFKAPVASPGTTAQHWIVQPLPLPTPSIGAPTPPVPPAAASVSVSPPLPRLPIAIPTPPPATGQVERPIAQQAAVIPPPVRIQAPTRVHVPPPPASPPEAGSGATLAAPATEEAPAHAVAPLATAIDAAATATGPADIPGPHQADLPGAADATSAAPPEGGLKKNAWLLRQPANAYSLQLVGVSDEAAVHRYITRHGISGQAFYVESRRRERPWFSVLYGLYPSRAAAAAALRQLPPALRQAGAWPRPLAAVQAEVRGRPRR